MNATDDKKSMKTNQKGTTKSESTISEKGDTIKSEPESSEQELDELEQRKSEEVEKDLEEVIKNLEEEEKETERKSVLVRKPKKSPEAVSHMLPQRQIAVARIEGGKRHFKKPIPAYAKETHDVISLRDQDAEVDEDVAKALTYKTKGSWIKRKGMALVFFITFIILGVLIVALWYYGYLKIEF